MACCATIDWEAHSTKERFAECKSKWRRALPSVEHFDWAQAELDLRLLKTIEALAVILEDLCGICLRNEDGELKEIIEKRLADSQHLVNLLHSGQGSEWPEEAKKVIRTFAQTLKHVKATLRETETQEACGGGATAENAGSEISKLLRNGSGAARGAAKNVASQGVGTVMNKTIAAIYGPVGRVEISDDKKLSLVFDSRWIAIIDGLNAAISAGKSFLDPVGQFRRLEGEQKEQLELLRELLLTRSRGELSLESPEDRAGSLESILSTKI